MANNRLPNRVALVTGAASGIGLAIAKRFVAEGASVFLADRNIAEAEQAVRDIGAGQAIALDVTDDASVRTCIARVDAASDGIEVLVNSAGIFREGDAVACTDDDWAAVIGINLTGSWRMCRAALPGMVARGRGTIINIASISAICADPNNAAYTASKAGVVGLTKSIALDFAASGIRANAICPGTMLTPLVLNRYCALGETEAAEQLAGFGKRALRYPVGRFGKPEEVAALAVYLASGEADFMTGAVLPLDGGITSASWNSTQ